MHREIVYFYILIGLIIVLYNYDMPQYYIAFVIFFLFKWTFNYRKCTISYIECVARGVKKEKGYLYNLLNGIVDLRYDKDIILIYIIGFIFLYYYFIVQNKSVVI